MYSNVQTIAIATLRAAILVFLSTKTSTLVIFLTCNLRSEWPLIPNCWFTPQKTSTSLKRLSDQKLSAWRNFRASSLGRNLHSRLFTQTLHNCCSGLRARNNNLTVPWWCHLKQLWQSQITFNMLSQNPEQPPGGLSGVPRLKLSDLRHNFLDLMRFPFSILKLVPQPWYLTGTSPLYTRTNYWELENWAKISTDCQASNEYLSAPSTTF